MPGSASSSSAGRKRVPYDLPALPRRPGEGAAGAPAAVPTVPTGKAGSSGSVPVIAAEQCP